MYRFYQLKPKFFFVLLLIVLSNSIKASDTRVENWTFLGGNVMLGKVDFSFHTANFFRHDGIGYFLNHTQLSLDFPSKSNWYFGIGYKQEYVELPNFWRTEYRPMLHLYYERDWGNINFRNRSRWEFRFMEGEFINRYRNQFQFSYTKFKNVEPFISTEFSFYFQPLDYTRQRTIVGSDFSIKHFNLLLFLGHQVNEDFIDEWGTTLILGTGLKYSF